MDEASAQQGMVTIRSQMRTILVVDDSRTNLHALAHRLDGLGYHVVLSERGAEALELIAARGFDLVLLDMLMPGLSGLEVLREIRSSHDTVHLPVILLTAQSDPRCAVQALEAGADDFFAQPFAFELLAVAIDRALARSRRLDGLKRTNMMLDARIAARAIELGELRSELAVAQAELQKLRA